MGKLFLAVIIITLPLFSASQNVVDSLKLIFTGSASDSVRYRACKFIYDHYEEMNRDSAFYYASQGLSLARKNNKRLAEIHSLANLSYQLLGLGRYAPAMKHLLEAFKIAEDPSLEKEKSWILFAATFSGNNRLLLLAYVHHITGVLMWQTENNNQAILHFSEARKIATGIGHDIREMMADMNLGRSYLYAGKADSALVFEKEAERLAIKTTFRKYLGQVYSLIGGVYRLKHDRALEKSYYHLGIRTATEQNNLISLSGCLHLLTRRFVEEGERDSAIYYARKNLETINRIGPVSGLSVNLGTIYENIYLAYKLSSDQDSIFKYQSLAFSVKDSLYQVRIKNLTEFQHVTLQEQLRLQDVEKEKVQYQSRMRNYAMLGGLAVLFVIGLLLYRNNSQNRKAKVKIEKAYEELKSTQRQLIHSEKMASLGELTAGIAHEIQNPLNFVSNFSEVNKELISEMNEEIGKGNLDGVRSIARDILANEEKINHHGRRADAIVKGMLLHSRSSSGKKEPTDINTLCDEYLRLSYHGLRAKDKSFNAAINTSFDTNLAPVNVMPQDIGRVLLNLLNNAFYSVNEKRKSAGTGYEPTVTLTTRKSNNSVKIEISDNGTGIPGKVIDKIFQPFFTTKPTGLGTGLGLSLSYDIVKSHGGEISVASKENEGTVFTIVLPGTK